MRDLGPMSFNSPLCDKSLIGARSPMSAMTHPGGTPTYVAFGKV
jgi:hypothetical protein